VCCVFDLQGELGERIATMHFFIINNTAAEQDYGVCVHTEKQYKDRQVGGGTKLMIYTILLVRRGSNLPYHSRSWTGSNQ
jgi:hypothetical protein